MFQMSPILHLSYLLQIRSEIQQERDQIQQEAALLRLAVVQQGQQVQALAQHAALLEQEAMSAKSQVSKMKVDMVRSSVDLPDSIMSILNDEHEGRGQGQLGLGFQQFLPGGGLGGGGGGVGGGGGGALREPIQLFPSQPPAPGPPISTKFEPPLASFRRPASVSLLRNLSLPPCFFSHRLVLTFIIHLL